MRQFLEQRDQVPHDLVTDEVHRRALNVAVLISASRDGMVDAAHDLSDGGLVQAVTESCLRGGKGARLVVPDGLDAFTFLFSESAGHARPRSAQCGRRTGGGPRLGA